MALAGKERRELYSATVQRLSEVIGASGKAEELVKLTTQIVQAGKRLAQNAPDALKNKSNAVLAEFVIAAKKIAQDTRAVDAASLQKLSSTRKAVESLMKELDAWHASQESRDDTDLSLDEILFQTSSRTESRASLSSQGGGRGSTGISMGPTGAGGMGLGGPTGVGVRRNSPTEIQAAVEHEKRLLNELKQQQDVLMKKAEPQANTSPRGNPEEILKVSVTGLSRSTSQLLDAAGQKTPSKEALMEPAIVMAKMVSALLDLVDSLFVSKFPMRSQVHSFCCMLVDNVIAYGDQSRTEDAASLRLISTQVPALMSALEVMVEQCHKRSQNIQENQQLSIQRNAHLHDLDVFGPGHSPRSSPAAAKKRKEPPVPPSKTPPVPQVQEFEIFIIICTNVAVDCETKHLLVKGSEISLKATSVTTVLDVRSTLTQRTGIAKDSIQLRFRGDDILTDDTRVTPNNPIPYFMFNLHEPGEDETTEFRKEHRRKNRLRIDTKDWSRVPSPVAVAIYDYEALSAEPGEEDNLEFEEGDLIEIVEKGGDGWWTGRVDGREGVFPASFVEMIQIPKTKDERKKLLKQFQQGRLGGTSPDIIEEQDPPPRPPEPKFTKPLEQQQQKSSSKSANKGLSKYHSTTATGSGGDSSLSPTKAPAGFGKLDRKSTDPNFALNEKDPKHKKRLSLFNNFKKKTTTPTSYAPLTDDFQRSPILSYRNREQDKPVIRELDEEMAAPVRPVSSGPSVGGSGGGGGGGGSGTSSSGTTPTTVVGRPLFRPKSSPRLAVKLPSPTPGGTSDEPSKTSPLISEGAATLPGDVSKPKTRRRPPPPPPPYAKKYGSLGMHSMLDRQRSNSMEGESKATAETPSQPSPLDLPSGPALGSGDSPTSSTSSPDQGAEPASQTAPISMMVTPASPPIQHHGGSSPKDGEMEDLLKNLEEFDEFSSTTSLTNGFLKSEKKKEERDYATIPRSELPIRLEDEQEEDDDDDDEEEEGDKEAELDLRPASVPVAITTPPFVDDRPCLTPSPTPGPAPTSSSGPAPTTAGPTPTTAGPTPTTAGPAPTSTTGPTSTAGPAPTTKAGPAPTTKAGLVPTTKAGPAPTLTVSTLTTPSSAAAKGVGSGEDVPPPVKPPRSRSKRLKMKKQMMEEEGAAEKEEESSGEHKRPPSPPEQAPPPPPSSQVPAAKPQPPQLPATRVAQASPKQGRPAFHKPKPPSLPPPPREEGPRKEPGSKPEVGQKPKPPPKPLEKGPKPSPVAPPRKKTRSLKRPKKEDKQDRDTAFSSSTSPTPRPPLAAKPKAPQAVRTQLQVQGERPQPSSAPVSRTASPDDSSSVGGARLKQEASTSVSNLCSSTSAAAAPAPPRLSREKGGEQSGSRGSSGRSRTKFLSYKTALKCITYLSSDHLVREDRLLMSGSGNSVLVKRLLKAIDNSEDVDLNSLQDPPSVLALLLSLYTDPYLGCIVTGRLAEELCASMQSADPLTVIGGKMEGLNPDYREMLKKLLRLFQKVLKYSDKNHTEVSDINKVFAPAIFEKIPSSQSEPLLAYLISTCDFVIT